MLSVLLSVAAGYLLGSIPSGFLVGKCRGIDIRRHGSGNIGATNVFRTLGRPWGILVFALDVLKGIVAVQLAMRAFACGGAGCALSPEHLGILAGFGCFLGHCFPVWLGFKGGKGVATGAGILIGLMPLTAALGLTLWGIVFYATRYVSLASIAAALSLPVIVWTIQRRFDALFWFTVVISAVAIWRHRANIRRLLAGTESRFEKKK